MQLKWSGRIYTLTAVSRLRHFSFLCTYLYYSTQESRKYTGFQELFHNESLVVFILYIDAVYINRLIKKNCGDLIYTESIQKKN